MKNYFIFGILGLAMSAQAGVVCSGTGVYLKDNSKIPIKIHVGNYEPSTCVTQIALNIAQQPGSRSFTFYSSSGYSLVADPIYCGPADMGLE